MHSATSALDGETVSLYIPETQSMQASSVSELYFPVAQAAQLLSASDPGVVWLLPAPQMMHLDSASRPDVEDHLPAAHPIQSAAAALSGGTVSLYVPATQSMQATSVPELYLPVAHPTQSLVELDPVLVTLLPPPHTIQTSVDCPTCSEYLPATQSIQSDTLSLSGDATVLYLPAAQLIQASSVSELYVPVSHATQSLTADEPVVV
jgi:hypothetical protein